jgi:hypothetical protein
MLGNEMSIDVCPITQQPLYANGDTKKFLTLLEMNECRAKPVDVGAQDPSAHIRIDASVEQLLPRDAIAGQPWQMRGIDLHKAQVLRAITISIDGQRIHVRFMQRDAAQERAIDAVVRRCVVQAICVGSWRRQRQNQ